MRAAGWELRLSVLAVLETTGLYAPTEGRRDRSNWFAVSGFASELCVGLDMILEKLMISSDKQLILNLNIKTEKNELYFHLECKSKFDKEFNIIRVADDDWLKPLTRIKMQYPERYSFDIYSENDSTCILLIIDLAKIHSKTDQQIVFS